MLTAEAVRMRTDCGPDAERMQTAKAERVRSGCGAGAD